MELRSSGAMPSKVLKENEMQDRRKDFGVSRPHLRIGPGCDSPEGRAYRGAKGRCENPKNPKYKDYGARGIEFRFLSRAEFHLVLGPKPSSLHSLDRINNNGHYEPENCRWATASQQRRNQRTFQNKPRKIPGAPGRLTDKDIQFMRRLKIAGAATRSLANLYEISQVHAANIVYGRFRPELGHVSKPSYANPIYDIPALDVSDGTQVLSLKEEG